MSGHSDQRRTRVVEALKSLAASEAVQLRVRGDCMAPALRNGERVDVVRRGLYLPGDVVAFLAADGRMLMHRCLGYRPSRSGWCLVTGADGAQGIDVPVSPRRVIGRVLRVNGRGDGFRISWRWRLRSGARFGRHAARWSLRRLAAAAPTGNPR